MGGHQVIVFLRLKARAAVRRIADHMSEDIGVRIGAGLISVTVDIGDGKNRPVTGHDAAPYHVLAASALFGIVDVAVQVVSSEDFQVYDPDQKNGQKGDEQVRDDDKLRIAPRGVPCFRSPASQVHAADAD